MENVLQQMRRTPTSTHSVVARLCLTFPNCYRQRHRRRVDLAGSVRHTAAEGHGRYHIAGSAGNHGGETVEIRARLTELVLPRQQLQSTLGDATAADEDTIDQAELDRLIDALQAAQEQHNSSSGDGRRSAS